MRDKTPVPLIKGTYCDKHGVVRVMAVVDGYVLARRPRCIPFVTYWKYFVAEYPAGDGV